LATIVASWIDARLNEPGAEPTTDDWSEHWQACVEQAAAADVCSFATKVNKHVASSLKPGQPWLLASACSW
jgi:hypothetical protein